MKNVKCYAIANDGEAKRIAITFDEVNEEGKIINPNKKVNRVITNQEALKAAMVIGKLAQTIVDGE